MKPLTGKVAVVAGATRGAGRGIARMLGEAGATVYCTGRGAAGTPSGGRHAGRSETVEETAEMVSAAGGTGIAVRVDHAVEAEVQALYARIRAEQGRLDVQVNVLGSPHVQGFTPFWETDLSKDLPGLQSYVWPHIITCRHAIPLMMEAKSGLIVTVQESHALGYGGSIFYDLGPATLKRLMYDLAEELAPHGVAAVAIAPGFMRTEEVLATLGATEESWREVAATKKEAQDWGFAGSETPCFVGRAIAALAADPEVMRKSGAILSSWSLSEEYGFTDVNGERPHWGRYFAENFPQYANPATRTGRRWELVEVGAASGGGETTEETELA
ncbi:SDR family NAD(P)-dependent oxidoreductase [Longimicrobium sp.]|uniref:SDR family NAD(P)-dependent oxidoreductase n=1 Tax=Longimicrobium sp. TaxID=2029185 RepID=UPI003B3A4CAA